MRAFVAIDVEEPLRRAISAEVDRISSHVRPSSVRWVLSENIHLTLKFLGNIDQALRQQVEEMLADLAKRMPGFRISVSDFGVFPHPRRPRVLWVGVKDIEAGLGRLQGAVESTLVALGFESENRTFHPHLTLGRVSNRVAGSQLKDLSEAVESMEIGELGGMHVAEFSLYRSDLQPDGVVYTRLRAFPLEGE